MVKRRSDLDSEASGPDLLAAHAQQVTHHLRFALKICKMVLNLLIWSIWIGAEKGAKRVRDRVCVRLCV